MCVLATKDTIKPLHLVRTVTSNVTHLETVLAAHSKVLLYVITTHLFLHFLIGIIPIDMWVFVVIFFHFFAFNFYLTSYNIFLFVFTLRAFSFIIFKFITALNILEVGIAFQKSPPGDKQIRVPLGVEGRNIVIGFRMCCVLFFLLEV